MGETKRIHLQIDSDPRLAAAAGGAAHYLGDAAGLKNTELAQLQKAIVAACKEEFHHLDSARASVEVTLTRLADRIEVSLCHKGGSPQGADAREGIDKIQCEKQGECVITRLTKYLNFGIRNT